MKNNGIEIIKRIKSAYAKERKVKFQNSSKKAGRVYVCYLTYFDLVPKKFLL